MKDAFLLFDRAAGFPSLSNHSLRRKAFLPVFLHFFCFRSFLLFNRAAGFLPPQPQFADAGAHRVCQGWPLLQRPPKAWPLHDRARRQTNGVGPNSTSIGSGSAIRDRRSLPVTSFSSRSSVARRIMGHRRLRRRNVPNGITEVSRKESRGRRGPSRQGRRFAVTAKGKGITHVRPLTAIGMADPWSTCDAE